MQRAQSTYLATQVSTASPAELTLLLYNGCIKFLKMTIVCIEKRDIAGKHHNLTKAINIIDELQITLNKEYEIAQQLESMYVFIRQQLNLASLRLDVALVQECVELMTDLRDTWSEAMKLVKK